MKRVYDHGPCPACGHALAKHRGRGRFACMRCSSEFMGHVRKRKSLRSRNPARVAAAAAKDFGGLAEFVRKFRCITEGCASKHVHAAHVKTRGAGNHAWLVRLDGSLVANLVPLCPECHHEQGATGIASFNEVHSFVVVQAASEARHETLAEAAEFLGELAVMAGLNPQTNTWKGAA